MLNEQHSSFVFCNTMNVSIPNDDKIPLEVYNYFFERQNSHAHNFSNDDSIRHFTLQGGEHNIGQFNIKPGETVVFQGVKNAVMTGGTDVNAFLIFQHVHFSRYTFPSAKGLIFETCDFERVDMDSRANFVYMSNCTIKTSKVTLLQADSFAVFRNCFFIQTSLKTHCQCLAQDTKFVKPKKITFFKQAVLIHCEVEKCEQGIESSLEILVRDSKITKCASPVFAAGKIQFLNCQFEFIGTLLNLITNDKLLSSSRVEFVSCSGKNIISMFRWFLDTKPFVQISKCNFRFVNKFDLSGIEVHESNLCSHDVLAEELNLVEHEPNGNFVDDFKKFSLFRVISKCKHKLTLENEEVLNDTIEQIRATSDELIAIAFTFVQSSSIGSTNGIIPCPGLIFHGTEGQALSVCMVDCNIACHKLSVYCYSCTGIILEQCSGEIIVPEPLTGKYQLSPKCIFIGSKCPILSFEITNFPSAHIELNETSVKFLKNVKKNFTKLLVRACDLMYLSGQENLGDIIGPFMETSLLHFLQKALPRKQKKANFQQQISSSKQQEKLIPVKVRDIVFLLSTRYNAYLHRLTEDEMIKLVKMWKDHPKYIPGLFLDYLIFHSNKGVHTKLFKKKYPLLLKEVNVAVKECLEKCQAEKISNLALAGNKNSVNKKKVEASFEKKVMPTKLVGKIMKFYMFE